MNHKDQHQEEEEVFELQQEVGSEIQRTINEILVIQEALLQEEETMWKGQLEEPKIVASFVEASIT